jgi:hypothetical protein
MRGVSDRGCNPKLFHDQCWIWNGISVAHLRMRNFKLNLKHLKPSTWTWVRHLAQQVQIARRDLPLSRSRRVDDMIEDAQPNERPLSKKGAAIPMVHSALRRTPFAAGARNQYPPTTDFNRMPAPTSNFYPPSGTCARNTYQHKRHNYPHDARQAKRRRIERDSDAHNVKPGHKPVPVTSYSKSRKFRKPEPTELLVDIPPECRKGAPGCQKLRKQWITNQIKDIQTNTGVMVQFGGYLENSARFTCTNDQYSVRRMIDRELF